MKHLVIGPGAMSYFLFLGALSALSDKGVLNDLETISGASAGSLLGFMFILMKGNVADIFKESADIPVQTIMKPNIKALFTSYGLVKSKKILGLLKKLTVARCGLESPTFADLYAYWPIKLYVSACCVDLSTTHYFSVDTHPEMSVHDALCMSIAVPFLIQSVKYGEWHYIDGGTLEETPCGAILDQSPGDVHVIMIGESTARVNNLRTYGYQILWSAFTLRHKYRMFSGTCIDTGDLDIFDFSMSLDTKVKTFVKGYTSCTTFPTRVEIDPPRTPDETQLPCPEHPVPTYDVASDLLHTSLDPPDEQTTLLPLGIAA